MDEDLNNDKIEVLNHVAAEQLHDLTMSAFIEMVTSLRIPKPKPYVIGDSPIMVIGELPGHDRAFRDALLKLNESDLGSHGIELIAAPIESRVEGNTLKELLSNDDDWREIVGHNIELGISLDKLKSIRANDNMCHYCHIEKDNDSAINCPMSKKHRKKLKMSCLKNKEEHLTSKSVRTNIFDRLEQSKRAKR